MIQRGAHGGMDIKILDAGGLGEARVGCGVRYQQRLPGVDRRARDAAADGDRLVAGQALGPRGLGRDRGCRVVAEADEAALHGQAVERQFHDFAEHVVEVHAGEQHLAHLLEQVDDRHARALRPDQRLPDVESPQAAAERVFIVLDVDAQADVGGPPAIVEHHAPLFVERFGQLVERDADGQRGPKSPRRS